MNCKNCGQELAADEIICTHCGQDNRPEVEEEPKAGINPWKIAFPAVAGLCLLLVLSWLLYFGVTGYWFPRANTIHNKDSYTASEDRLLASRDSVVAVLGEHKLTNAQLRVFYSRMKQEFKGEYQSNVPLDEQMYDQESGLTWQQYLLELSLNIWKQFRVMTDQAKKAGFEIPEEYQQHLDGLEESLAASAENNGFDSVNDLLSEDICTGCTLEDYKYYLELYYWDALYYDELVDKAEISDEDLEAYYEANKEAVEKAGFTKDGGLLINVRNILVEPDGAEDEHTEMEWEACYNKADALLNQWLQGARTEESFAQLATEHSSDKESFKNGGLYQYVSEYYFGSVDVRHILIMPEGGTKNESGITVYTEAEWEACRQKAQKIYDEYLNGKRTEEHFSSLAVEHSEDSNASSGGIYEDVLKTEMVDTFDAWIFDKSRKPGDTGLVKTQYGYHIMYFVHRDCDMNDWLFSEERKPGDYELIKTDDGYQILYYVRGEEGWALYCEMGVASDKAKETLNEWLLTNTVKTTYGKVLLEE